MSMYRVEYFKSDQYFFKNGQEVNLKSENLNKVLSVLVNQIHNGKPDKYGYHRIHNSKFSSVYTGYSNYLRFFRHYGYIDRSNYEVGKDSFGYRLSNSFKASIRFDKIINLDIRHRGFRVKDDDSTNYIPDWIKEKIKKDFLSCNILFNLKEQQLKKVEFENGSFIDIKKWINNNFNLFKWKEGRRTFNWSTHRLYTNFTNLSSIIRQNYIQLNNEELVEFDISSSFPLMLAKHCLEIEPTNKNEYEFRQYCTDIANGRFYDNLTWRLNNIRNSHKPGTEIDRNVRLINRNDAKKLFQIYLNDEEEERIPYIRYNITDIAKFMEFNFPTIHEIVTNYKHNGVKLYDVLVELETKLIFKIVQELYDKYDDIKILTCHDAIYVPKSFESRVQEIWDANINAFTFTLPIEDDSDVSTIDETGFTIDCNADNETSFSDDCDFWDD